MHNNNGRYNSQQMKIKIIFVSLAAIFCSVILAAQQIPGDKMPRDKEILIGKLDNGLTYYIRHSENPKNSADFYIAHNVGALQEDDHQNGLAHFLEHMAFNGTQNFPGKDLLNYLAANGVRFGANVNAYTSRFRTVYNISDVPVGREALIDSVILALHDWSYYISCEPDEIEAERGVIREEWRRREDSRTRVQNATDVFLYHGAKHINRTVIGDINVINNFKPDALVSFYHKWYRPDMQAIIVVGDIDPKTIEAKIKEICSSIPAATNPAPKEFYDIPACDSLVVGYVTDPEIRYRAAKIYYVQPYQEVDTRSGWKNYMMRDIYTEILRERFVASCNEDNSAARNVIAVNGRIANVRRDIQLTVSPKEKDMLAASVEQTLKVMRTVEQHGFTQDEFDRAQKNVVIKNKLERTPSSITNKEIVGLCIEDFTNGIPCTEPIERNKIIQDICESITLEDINAMIPSMTTQSEQIIVYVLNENETELFPTEEQTREIFSRMAQTDVDMNTSNPPTVEEVLAIDRIKPSPVVKVEKIKKFDAERWTLKNGIRIVWKQIDGVEEVKNQMLVMACCPIGFAKQDDIAAMKIAGDFFGRLGIKDVNNQMLRVSLASVEALVKPEIKRNQTLINGSSSKADFERMLQMYNLYLTAPNFSETEFNKYIERYYKDNFIDPRGDSRMSRDSIAFAKYGNHPWVAVPTAEDCKGMTAAKARKIYDKQFGNAADFTFYIIGELPAETVKPLVEKYIGSLPVAKPAKKVKSTCNIVPGRVDYQYVCKTSLPVPSTTIDRTYHGKLKYETDNYIALSYLSYILRNRYTRIIREEKGGTYTVRVDSGIDSRDNGLYELVVSFQTNPQMVEELVAEVDKQIRDIAENGVTESELNDTKSYMVKYNTSRNERNVHSPYYWFNKMSDFDDTGVLLEYDNVGRIENVSPATIQKIAKLLIEGDVFTSYYVVK